MSLVVLAAALPSAEARDFQTPLPPAAVQAHALDAGVLVSWLPPLHDGGSPVETYTVYRLDGLQWTPTATISAATTSLVDPSGTSLTFYHVVASNEAGPSPASQPAAASLLCPFVGASVDEDFPFVHPGINWDCFGNIRILWVNG